MEPDGGKGAVLSTIRTVAETGSTNADMIALAATGLGEGVWLRADRQTGGRGRQGRHWVSPPGNFYGSTLVRLHPGAPPPATLALVAAVALAEAVAVHAPAAPLQIKWPNDLLLAGAKLAGILLERTGDAVVVGIGVNLAHHPQDLDRPVTSLAALAAAPDPQAFAETLAECFARWLGRWRGEGLGPVRARWLDRAHPAGTALSVHLPDGTVAEGLFHGLDGDGALILRLADGAHRAIHAGDVFLI
ncbi:biotin--[acetyl-CoA-carboxylase] ligase [Sphingomonas sp.]|uniref:biotin--[acetyl-CoA-carboxylase] ligase n=1 Tax=Sphingomonas sp. TaxID=28214 RepID=UPI001D997E00|nr:biotin--[acetyl-CoA-carboxylase] ligase [Sphingomonas sp.]MBX9796153.1 biotin--[acetyl-CoA-carboxylase] ligase [Sphingomonas sp.]